MAEQVQYGLFQYTDDGGRHWTVRCDKDWGADTDSGLGANAGDPPFQFFSRRYHPRYAIFVDTVTGHTTRRVCGTTASTAYVGGGSYTKSLQVAGSRTAVVYTWAKRYPENIPSINRGLHPFTDSAVI